MSEHEHVINFSEYEKLPRPRESDSQYQTWCDLGVKSLDWWDKQFLALKELDAQEKENLTQSEIDAKEKEDLALKQIGVEEKKKHATVSQSRIIGHPRDREIGPGTRRDRNGISGSMQHSSSGWKTRLRRKRKRNRSVSNSVFA